VTIGGGPWCLDASPIRAMPGREAFSETLSTVDAQPVLRARIARRGPWRNCSGELWQNRMAQQVIENTWPLLHVRPNSVGSGDLAVDAAPLGRLKLLVISNGCELPEEDPLVGRLSKEETARPGAGTVEVFGRRP